MAIVVYYPVIENDRWLFDTLSRAAWHLVHFPIERIIIPVANSALQEVEWQVASGMDPLIAGNFASLKRIVDLVVINAVGDLENCLRSASIILRWKHDALPSSNDAQFAISTKGKEIWEVDPVKVRMEGSYYIEAGLALTANREALIQENRNRFTALSAKLGKFVRAYLFATGPSVDRYSLYDYSGAISIVCNSVIFDEALMERVRPKFLVFADPIFHFGPSQYAGAFRARLLESANKYDFTIFIPFKYFPLFSSVLPELRDRTIAIPFFKRDSFNFDLDQDYSVKTTANILTLLMMPLACHFADEICLLGCNGRPFSENDYFWNHNQKTQINDKMSNIKEVHPGFFDINYNDYYNEHCDTLESQLAAAERINKNIVSLGHSYIPALKNRIGIGKRNSKITAPNPHRAYIIDPDGRNCSGHYMAYNDKVISEFRALGIESGALCRRDIDKEILASRTHFYPILSHHSWEVAGHPEIIEFATTFEIEIKGFLDRAFSECDDVLFLYLYCGSLEHALILSRIAAKYDKLFVNINLFYLSFDYLYEVVSVWNSYIRAWDFGLGRGRVTVSLPTTELRNRIAEDTGYVLPVALHPSTGVTDKLYTNLVAAVGETNINRKLNVLFPGALRPEKGCVESLECARLLADTGCFKV